MTRRFSLLAQIAKFFVRGAHARSKIHSAYYRSMNFCDWIFSLRYLHARRISLRLFYKRHHHYLYRGIPCRKFPTDLAIYQMLINHNKPDLIVEIGTNSAGSALYFQDILDKQNKGGKVHTIDIVDMVTDRLVLENPNIIRFFGGWENYPVELLDQSKETMVIDDGSHVSDDTLAALRKFSPLVSIGQYYIVEDAVLSKFGMNRRYRGGPRKSISTFLKSNKSFLVDSRIENFFGKNSSSNSNGYLLRIE
jgi:cephalosporin hydroxylase